MTERFCKNDDGDCPCLWEGFTCKSLPEWKRITDTEIHYCYLGRLIMERGVDPPEPQWSVGGLVVDDEVKS